MRKKHSQEIALFFIVVDFIFLVPLLLLAFWLSPILIFSVVLSFFGLFTRHFYEGAVFLSFIVIVLSFLAFGLYLFVGYFKHYKNRLTRRQTDRLWVKTIIYNAIFFFPAFYIKLQCWFTVACRLDGYYHELWFLSEYPIISSALTLWWFLAIFLAFSALASMGEATGTGRLSEIEYSVTENPFSAAKEERETFDVSRSA